MPALEQLYELQHQLNQVQNNIAEFAQQNGIQAIRELFQPLFDLGVKNITWTQYTPYFNDGEPCEFTVYDMYVTKEENPDLDQHPDDEGDWLHPWNLIYAFEEYNQPDLNVATHWRPSQLFEARARWNASHQAVLAEGWTPESAQQFYNAYKTASDAIHSNDQLMELVFGDHCSILFRSDGTYSVDHYEHD